MYKMVRRLPRVPVTGVLVALAFAFLPACYKAPASSGSGTTTPGGLPPSGLRFRAFVSQTISSSIASPGLNIVDATLDKLARVPGVTAGNAPGLMAVPSNKQVTLVFDSSNNSINVVNNHSESSNGSIGLPGPTESMALPSDGTVAFAAVHDAPIAGKPVGAVEMLNVSRGSLDTPISVPGVRFVVLSPDGTHLLAFSDNQNLVTIITLSNIGTATAPQWILVGDPNAPPQLTDPSLDHPLWAVFTSDSSKAFILSCGPECGGTAAALSVLDFSGATPAITSTLSLPSATYGVLSGSTLYVAGTAPTPPGGNTCAPSSTAATSCGQLSVVDISTLTVSKTLVITDGMHDRMAVTDDNQVYVGARGCTNVNSSTEQRGCLSIFAPATGKVIIGTDPGDVTAIQSITGRPRVYVVENGELRIWDTTTDTLLTPDKQVNILGQAVDVKLPD